jgi:tocopherol cyclase
VNIWRPAVYHGHGKRAPFFEGWYFKLIDPAGDQRFAIIPGIFKHPTDSHSFIQVLDGTSAVSYYCRYDAATFHAAVDRFDVWVGPNHFQSDRIALDLNHDGHTIAGELAFEGLTPWPVTTFSPGVMGWYGLLPFMECYHGVLSFDHTIQGALVVDGESINFSGGRGYIEKDWGEAFPRGYIWMQSNHFCQPGTCLTASVALIPWLRRAFRGFIVGLWHEGTLYRFATYTGAVVNRLELTDTHVLWTLTGKTGPDNHPYRLELDAERAEGGLLHAPDRTAMVARIVESMTTLIDVRLMRLDGSGGKRMVYADTGHYGGMEIAGDLAAILDGYHDPPKGGTSRMKV